MKLFYFIFLLLVITCESSAADSTAITDKLINDIETGVIKSIDFFTAPVSFSGEEWLWASGLAAGTLLMISLDDELETAKPNIFHKNKLFQSMLAGYGDVDYANIFSISLYAGGLLTGEEAVRKTGRLLIESLFLSGSTALLLRLITGRPRPYMTEGSSFKWFQSDLDYQSFPSGHTTVVFAVSTVLAERIDNDWARIGIYGLASLAAVERIYSSDHWFSDVIIGGLLGYGSAAFVLNKERESENNVGTEGVSIFPSLRGINLMWRF